jgi:hypothetical protein
MNNERVHPTIDRHGNPCPSLTKREYFAAMAMQGSLSANPVYNFDSNLTTQQLVAMVSVSFADALLEELERTKS